MVELHFRSLKYLAGFMSSNCPLTAFAAQRLVEGRFMIVTLSKFSFHLPKLGHLIQNSLQNAEALGVCPTCAEMLLATSESKYTFIKCPQKIIYKFQLNRFV